MPRRELHDRFFRQAKAEGYVARSAYKLKEINQRKRVLKSGDRVLDLGCAPGAWLQVAREIVGPRGSVVGVDLQEVRHGFGDNVHIIQGDINDVTAGMLTSAAGGAFDVVLSDMAPSTSGHGDHFLSVRLCRRVLEMLPAMLRPGGNLVMKVFEGEQYPALLRETQDIFRDARGFRPKATRDVSSEMYIAAHGYRGPTDAALPTSAPREG